MDTGYLKYSYWTGDDDKKWKPRHQFSAPRRTLKPRVVVKVQRDERDPLGQAMFWTAFGRISAIGLTLGVAERLGTAAWMLMCCIWGATVVAYALVRMTTR